MVTQVVAQTRTVVKLRHRGGIFFFLWCPASVMDECEDDITAGGSVKNNHLKLYSSYFNCSFFKLNNSTDVQPAVQEK